MSSDLIAWIVGITLSVVVVGLGLRRNLSDVTRNWLPQFGKAQEPTAVPPSPFDDGQGRREYFPRQRQFLMWGYLLLGLCNATFAVLWADDRLLHAIGAVIFTAGALVFRS
jgi:hypothetical protein